MIIGQFLTLLRTVQNLQGNYLNRAEKKTTKLSTLFFHEVNVFRHQVLTTKKHNKSYYDFS